MCLLSETFVLMSVSISTIMGLQCAEWTWKSSPVTCVQLAVCHCLSKVQDQVLPARRRRFAEIQPSLQTMIPSASSGALRWRHSRRFQLLSSRLDAAGNANTSACLQTGTAPVCRYPTRIVWLALQSSLIRSLQWQTDPDLSTWHSH